MEVVPFGDRLQGLLHERGPHVSQAWLSDESGVDRSLISRIIKGERPPTAETLQSFARVLGLDVAALVAGTSAEGRLASVSDHVRRSDYEEAVGKVIEYETRIRDLEATARSADEQLLLESKARHVAEDAATKASAEADRMRTALSEIKERYEAQSAELSRYQAALQHALTDFSTVKTRVGELQAELGEARKSSKASALLAGVAAVTGVATLAHFLGDAPPAAKPEATRKTKT